MGTPCSLLPHPLSTSRGLCCSRVQPSQLNGFPVKNQRRMLAWFLHNGDCSLPCVYHQQRQMGLQHPPGQGGGFLGGLLRHILCCKGGSLQRQAETLQLISWVMSHSQAAFSLLGGFEELLFLYKLGGFGVQRAVSHAFPCPWEGRHRAGLRHEGSNPSPLLERGKDALWAYMCLYMCACVCIHAYMCAFAV